MMNLSTCMDILQQRCSDKCNCVCTQTIESLTTAKEVVESASPKVSSVVNVLQSWDVLDLIDLLLTLHRERVATYKLYDDLLERILDDNSISEYPALCAEVTCRFAVVSNKICRLKDALQSKGDMTEIINSIIQIQSLEKKKLMLVAARHMDMIQARMPYIQFSTLQLSAVDTGSVYVNKKICSIECSIIEEIDNIQAFKSDLL